MSAATGSNGSNPPPPPPPKWMMWVMMTYVHVSIASFSMWWIVKILKLVFS